MVQTGDIAGIIHHVIDKGEMILISMIENGGKIAIQIHDDVITHGDMMDIILTEFFLRQIGSL